jgi:hypothetical protein
MKDLYEALEKYSTQTLQESRGSHLSPLGHRAISFARKVSCSSRAVVHSGHWSERSFFGQLPRLPQSGHFFRFEEAIAIVGIVGGQQTDVSGLLPLHAALHDPRVRDGPAVATRPSGRRVVGIRDLAQALMTAGRVELGVPPLPALLALPLANAALVLDLVASLARRFRSHRTPFTVSAEIL